MIVVVAPERVDEVAAAAWLPAGRRRSSPAARRARRRSPRASAISHAIDPGGGDRPVLVHDGARPLVVRGAGRRRRRGRRAPRRGDPGAARRRDAQARRRRPGRRDRRPARRSPPPRRPQGARRRLLLEAWDRYPPDGEPRVHRRGRPARGLYHPRPCDSRRTDEPQGDAARRPAPGRAAAATPTAPRVGFGHDSHPFGPGLARSGSGGIEIAGAPRARRALRRRRRAPRGRRRAARRGGPGRPRPPVPGRRAGRRAASTARCCCGEVVARLAGAGPAPGDRGRDGDRRPAAARGRASTRCARRSPALLGVDAGRGQRQGVDRQPRRATTAPAGRCRRAPSRRSGRRHDDPAPGHAHRCASGRSSRSSPAASASTAAGRRSTARPTSATSARSCSPTCSCATCATAGCAVTWVMNLTDIDDKIIRGAAAEGITTAELADRYAARFLADADALGMTRPDVLPRATEHIPQIVDLVADAARHAATPIARTTARSSSASRPGPRTAASPASTPTRCGSASASRPTSTARTTSATSPCGRARSPASRRGTRRSVPGGPAGTSSARR